MFSSNYLAQMARFLLGLVLAVWMLPALATGLYTDMPESPNTHADPLVKGLLKAANSGDREQMQRFIEQHFDSEFLKRFPMSMHLNFLQDTVQGVGELGFHAYRTYLEKKPDTELVVIVKGAKTELWYAVNVFVTEQAEPKISGLRFFPARIPSDLPKAEPLTLEQAAQALQAYAERLAQRDVFSGALLLANNDQVLFKTAHGQASKRFAVPNNVQTRFNLGSMNKMFTSVAIMQLVQAGKLSMQDKLSQYVDSSWLAKEVSQQIEIRHLLTHTSGLGSYFNQTYMASSKNNFRALEDYKPLVKDEKLSFTPGSQYRYSNTGMFMLGVVIEKVSGKNYFQYIQEHIYQPAGMLHSGEYEMDQPTPNLAIGYTPDATSPTGWRNNLYTHVLKGGPAGGGFSTVEDLHRFAVALMQHKLLDESSTRAMLSAKPELHSPNQGYGFAVLQSSEQSIVGHGGGFEGISSNLDVFLEKGYVVAVMSNYTNGSRAIETMARDLLARVQ